jgi:hypothetical protein
MGLLLRFGNSFAKVETLIQPGLNSGLTVLYLRRISDPWLTFCLQYHHGGSIPKGCQMSTHLHPSLHHDHDLYAPKHNVHQPPALSQSFTFDEIRSLSNLHSPRCPVASEQSLSANTPAAPAVYNALQVDI